MAWECSSILTHLLMHRFLMNISINANLIKTQIFLQMKYDLKDQGRTH